MSLFTTITVFPHERALEYVDGVCTRVLEPGRYRPARRATYRRVHVLERIVTTAPQDVLTSDGVSVRVTAAIRWKVVDPRAYVETVADPAAAVYLAVQIALRDELVAVEVDALVREARLLGRGVLTDGARAAGSAVGIDVVEVVGQGRDPADGAPDRLRRAGHHPYPGHGPAGGGAGGDRCAAVAGERREAARRPPGAGPAPAGAVPPPRLHAGAGTARAVSNQRGAGQRIRTTLVFAILSWIACFLSSHSGHR